MTESIPWAAAQRQIASLQEYLSDGLPADHAARQRILQERATALASKPIPKSLAETREEWLILGNGRERYALRTTAIQEVIPLPAATPLPRSPFSLFQHRGEFWLLLFLRSLPGFPGTWAAAEETSAVLLRHPQQRLALACPEAGGIRSLAEGSSGLSRPRDRFVSHYLQDAEHPVMAINVPALFDHFHPSEESLP